MSLISKEALLCCLEAQRDEEPRARSLFDKIIGEVRLNSFQTIRVSSPLIGEMKGELCHEDAPIYKLYCGHQIAACLETLGIKPLLAFPSSIRLQHS